MSVSPVQAISRPLPVPSPEEMLAVAAARPAALHLQAVALTAVTSGTTGQGTPAIDANGRLDLYA